MIIGKNYITKEEKIARLERLRGYSFLQPVCTRSFNLFIVGVAMSNYAWAMVRAKFYQRVLKDGVKAAEILLDSMAYTSELGKRLIKNL